MNTTPSQPKHQESQLQKFAREYLGFELLPLQVEMIKAWADGKMIVGGRRAGKTTAERVTREYIKQSLLATPPPQPANPLPSGEKITCSVCGRQDVPDWDGEGHCIKCARDLVLKPTPTQDSGDTDALIEDLGIMFVEQGYNSKTAKKAATAIQAYAHKATLDLLLNRLPVQRYKTYYRIGKADMDALIAELSPEQKGGEDLLSEQFIEQVALARVTEEDDALVRAFSDDATMPTKSDDELREKIHEPN